VNCTFNVPSDHCHEVTYLILNTHFPSKKGFEEEKAAGGIGEGCYGGKSVSTKVSIFSILSLLLRLANMSLIFPLFF